MLKCSPFPRQSIPLFPGVSTMPVISIIIKSPLGFYIKFPLRKPFYIKLLKVIKNDIQLFMGLILLLHRVSRLSYYSSECAGGVSAFFIILTPPFSFCLYYNTQLLYCQAKVKNFCVKSSQFTICSYFI